MKAKVLILIFFLFILAPILHATDDTSRGNISPEIKELEDFLALAQAYETHIQKWKLDPDKRLEYSLDFLANINPATIIIVTQEKPLTQKPLFSKEAAHFASVNQSTWNPLAKKAPISASRVWLVFQNDPAVTNCGISTGITGRKLKTGEHEPIIAVFVCKNFLAGTLFEGFTPGEIPANLADAGCDKQIEAEEAKSESKRNLKILNECRVRMLGFALAASRFHYLTKDSGILKQLHHCTKDVLNSADEIRDCAQALWNLEEQNTSTFIAVGEHVPLLVLESPPLPPNMATSTPNMKMIAKKSPVHFSELENFLAHEGNEKKAVQNYLRVVLPQLYPRENSPDYDPKKVDDETLGETQFEQYKTYWDAKKPSRK